MARIHTYATDSSISGSEKLLGTDSGTTKLFSLTDLRTYFSTSTAAGTTFTGNIVPNADDSLDIGTSSAQWQDLYVDGIAYIDQIGTDGDPSTVYISGGEIDGAVIGGESAAAGTFTTLTAATINATSALQIGGTAISLNSLSDVLVENNSVFIGNMASQDPSGTASYNVAIGDNALDSITDGDNNTAVGYDALTALTEGVGNIAIGYQALDSVTTSDYAIAIGHGAGAAITTTDTKGIYIGVSAGAAVTSGAENILIGYQAGDAITNGAENVVIGNQALSTEDGGGRNVVIGHGAGQSQNAGTNTYSTLVGYDAGTSITTGLRNTLIGATAGVL